LQYDAESFKPESWLTMFTGFGVPQESCDSRVDDIDVPRMMGALEVIRGSVERAAAAAMPHEAFVAKFCPAPRE
jgi:tryptophan halogenase